MKARSLFVVSLVAALSACGSPDESARLSAQKAVSLRLKDPESARFRESFVVLGDRSEDGKRQWQAVCGLVDGKNSFGAYSGGTRFVASQLAKQGVVDTYLVRLEERDPDPEFESLYWTKNCLGTRR